jgi:Ca2+-binding EF-hand superfamily protein
MIRSLAGLAVMLTLSTASASDLPIVVFASSAPRTLPTRLFADWSWDDLPKAVFAALPPSEKLPDSLFTYSVDDELQDLLLLSDARPVMIRVHLFVDGRGFRLPWGEFITRVHSYLDRNSDGILTVKETQIPNWQQMLMVGLFRGNGMQNNLTGVKIDPDGDGKVSNKELADFLRPSYGPFQAQQAFEGDNRAEAIFGHLDKNKDRKLTRAEVEAATLELAPLDLNEDEAYSVAEMGPMQSRFAAQQRRFTNQNMNQGNVQLVSTLSPGEPRNAAANNLLNKYDKNSGADKPGKDRKLTRDEIGLDVKSFKLADTSSDGMLDLAEITNYLSKKTDPDLELTIRVARDTGLGTIELTRPTTPAAGARRVNDDTVDLDLDVDKTLIVLAENTPQRGFNVRDFFIQNYKAADADGNGYVDKKEIQNNFLNQIFAVADRDGDDRLMEQELIGYLDLSDEAGKCRSTLSFSDLGRALFTNLDENHDGRLGAREIRAAWQVLERHDRDKDGKITPKELPRHLKLTFGRAQTGPQFGDQGGDDEGKIAKADPARAPLWFLQMDRNRDGDISTREFLGSPAAFTRIDTDHDGLISASEAAKVK